MIRYFKTSLINKRFGESLIYRISCLSVLIGSVHSQNVFTRTCQDPLIQAHLAQTGHTYCFHACGYFTNNVGSTDYSTCTANGECLCNYPCGSNPPAIPFATDICPPQAADPPDPDTNFRATCIQYCSTACPQGQGEVCGESLGAVGPNRDTYAKICTCFCPPQPCGSNQTTTMMVALLKNPVKPLILFKKKKLYLKIILLKIIKLLIALFSLGISFFIKLFLFYIYYCWIYDYYEWVSGFPRFLEELIELLN